MKRLWLVSFGLLVLPMGASAAVMSNAKAEAGLSRCQRYDTAIADQSAKLAEILQTKRAAADRIKLRIDGMVGRLEARGLDSRKLTIDQTEFSHRMALVKRDFAEVQSAVTATTGSCGAAGVLEKARLKLNVLNSDVADLQLWLDNILLPDVGSYKTDTSL